MGYLLILLKSLASLTESVLIRQYNKKHTTGSAFFTGIISLVAMLFFLLTDTDGFSASPAVLPYAIAFGAIYCVTYLLTFVALACGPFTPSMLIISYSLVFPIFYGIVFLHDATTPFTWIGFALLAASLFLVRGTKKEGDRKASLKWGITIALVCVGNGVLAIIQKMQQLRFEQAYDNEFMVISLAISAVALLAYGTFRDRAHLKEIVRYGLPYAAASGAANGLNNYLGLIINTLLPLSISSPLISGVKIVLSYLTSSIFFKEKYIPRQIVGVAIGAAALVFLNL